MDFAAGSDLAREVADGSVVLAAAVLVELG